MLYSLIIANLSNELNPETYTIADDTAILSVHKNIEIATTKLQNHLNKIETWTEDNKIKINTN